MGFQSIRIKDQGSIKLHMNIDDDAILEISGDQESPLSFHRLVNDSGEAHMKTLSSLINEMTKSLH